MNVTTIYDRLTVKSIIITLCILHPLFVFCQNEAPPDSVKYLQIRHLQFSSNSSTALFDLPSFEEFAQKANFSGSIRTLGMNLKQDSLLASSEAYLGFMTNFLFASKFLNKKAAYERSFFSIAFEAGRNQTLLYSLLSNDTLAFEYQFQSDIFRITLGYRRFLMKQDRRFNFYTGLEFINEFNISAVVLESSLGNNNIDLEDDTGGQRKLYAQKAYNLYLNVPIGVHFKFSKQKQTALFFNFNLAFGTQKLDPFRVNSLHTGGRLGISLGI